MNTFSIDPATTVGQLARRFPAATRVLDRYGMDYCCGGDRSLADACMACGIKLDDLMDDIWREQQIDDGKTPDWNRQPLADLCRYIVTRFHEPLRKELPGLRALAVRVAVAHGESEPRLMELASLVDDFSDDIEAHMRKEEQVLFPAIAYGDQVSVDQPISCMKREHKEHGDRLTHMARLTDDFTAPDHACASWFSLCEHLRELDAEMKAHVNLENNILFVRAQEAVESTARAGAK